MSDSEVYFEFIQVGQYVRIAAIHAHTDTEVVVMAPAAASQHHMKQLALAKLRKKLDEGQSQPSSGKYA